MTAGAAASDKAALFVVSAAAHRPAWNDRAASLLEINARLSPAAGRSISLGAQGVHAGAAMQSHTLCQGQSPAAMYHVLYQFDLCHSIRSELCWDVALKLLCTSRVRMPTTAHTSMRAYVVGVHANECEYAASCGSRRCLFRV